MFCHSGDEIITQFVNFGLEAKDTDVNDVFFELNMKTKNVFWVNMAIHQYYITYNSICNAIIISHQIDI